MDHIELISSPLDITTLYTLLGDPGCGASSVFVGTTRDSFEGKKVLSLEYEAYEPMAIKEMKTICTDLRAKWPDLKHIVIYHRLGSVPVGEASVVIATSAPHRLSALESVSLAVDQLKTRVPIWKKELYEGDDPAQWKENKESLRPKHSQVTSNRFNFATCKIEKQNENISDKLVQIRVHDDELSKRVECFVRRKRMEINMLNVRDFTQNQSLPHVLNNEEAEVSCARTQGAVIKQEQSNCHLKVRRVNNKSGPQQMHLRPNYAQELNKLMGSSESSCDPSGQVQNDLANNRLRTIESYMGLSANNQSLLSRLKQVENRILLLESTSPEYNHFTNNLKQPDSEEPSPKRLKRKIYCAEELNNLLKSFKDETGS
ncbi:uncharacterized protein Dwil_GK13883 [Drosophila willistoni]|uniref:Molybdopterin synthase catalytic subunit n=1 Tax=Drosophila willistoni TaxID=7260 RepID=MOC2B_DROWI|nr:molybdopterin synthase catalytic subunit [Drosophila willistoni]B4NJW0.1 RecName: Full=Molybdopterin synthase catalytic subunit; AltName: Full=Molybdenum cofactor synthesis protein 2 large subunit; AltName: Full=Molybdenum cofactor synthesis protein 2B; Short=MOCS2B [Drosophila willistoni]EDW83962.1 uncharacterized protein Dwil_GK13883 [Drosophila willistoni]